MAPWLQVLEAYLVQALLRTPAFHRGVEKVARNVHRIRHGVPPEEMGGTKIDQPGNGSFLKHFTEEVQTQLGRAEAKSGEAGARSENSVAASKPSRRENIFKKESDGHNAEAAWSSAQKSSSEAPKQGFLGEYVGALREQLRGGK